MKPQNELALIVAYYLSRLDKSGYALLGYKNFHEAATKIGLILDVKPNTIKNMRDEFDPYHQNTRIGWQRELRGSRLKILNSFQQVDDNTLLELVKEILYNKDFKKTEGYQDIHALFGSRQERHGKQSSAVFILRGPTGKAAEEAFIKYFKNVGKPANGKLIDCRELGCGYDFEIGNRDGQYFIEVKGLALDSGGVLFTNKEWQTALKYGKKYYLVLIKNISNTPKVVMIQNPAEKLKAKKSIYTTVQVNWNVSKKNLLAAGF